MKLTTVLNARLDGCTFTAYKYKDRYLVRRQSKHINWAEYQTFDDVLRALSWFEITVAIEKEEDDSIPF